MLRGKPLGHRRFLRGSPVDVKKTRHSASMRAPGRRHARPRRNVRRHRRRWSCPRPARRAARVSSALESTPSMCLVTCSRLGGLVEPERAPIDHLRLGEAVLRRHRGAPRPSASRARAAPRPAGRRNRLRWRSRRPISAPWRAARRVFEVASVSTSSTASRSRAARSWSSRMVKPGATPASSGKRCSRRSQKAWMVCTLRPPGVSMAIANSWRARCISSAAGARPSSSASGFSQLGVAGRHPAARRSNTRLDISAAAALV